MASILFVRLKQWNGIILIKYTMLEGAGAAGGLE